jgi:hypothetical protein
MNTYSVELTEKQMRTIQEALSMYGSFSLFGDGAVERKNEVLELRDILYKVEIDTDLGEEHPAFAS